MREFKTPVLSVQRLDPETIIEGNSSSCFETFDCKECYCTAVQCDPVWTCKGLVCPSLEL